jgi:hypothetical protein
LPPARNNDSQSTPPHPPQGTQSNSCIQKIDVPDANKGTILLDSGSTINVSGKSRYFSITSKFSNPLTVLLAIAKYVALIEFIGRLEIPTPTGTMTINDVYYCKEIKGLMLSTGRLVEEGWSFVHEKTDARLVDGTGNIFYLKFLNHCRSLA